MNKKIAFPLILGLTLAIGGVIWASAAGSGPDTPEEFNPQRGGLAMELVSQFWGSYAAVKTAGDLAYVPQGQRLSVFDISDPVDIQLVGQSEVMISPSDNLEISGDYAFLIDPGVTYYEVGSRLHVLDISDPTAPFEATYLDNYNNKAYDIELYNGYAFIANSDNLWVVDVHAPLNPTGLAQGGISEGYAENIKVRLHNPSGIPYAYLTANEYLVVFDVNDPAHPVKKASLNVTTCYLDGLALSDNRLFGIDDCGRLIIVDISDPVHPSVVGQRNVTDFPMSVETFGDLLFIGGWDGLYLLDASGTGIPSDLGFYPSDDPILGIDQTPDPGILTIINASDLILLDVDDPDNPLHVGAYRQEGGVSKITGSGDRVFISRGYSSYTPRSVEAYDLRDPYHPIHLGSLPVREAQVQQLAGDLLLMLRQPNDFDSSIPGALILADVSDPAHMFVTDLFTTTMHSLVDVAVFRAKAYLAHGNSGLYILDISDPYNILEINHIDPEYWIEGVSVASPANEPDKVYAYVGAEDYPGGFKILDVTDPLSIIEKGSAGGYMEHTQIYTPKLSSGTLPAAGYYIAADDGYNVILLDVSNPEAPVVVDSDSAESDIYDLTALGDLLYVSAGLKGARIYQYTGSYFDDLGYYRWPEEVVGTAVTGNILHLATRGNGLFNAWLGPLSWLDPLPTSGGVLTSTFHNTTLMFPSGAFTTTVGLAYTPRYPGNMPSRPGLAGIGVFFELDAWDPESYGDPQPVIPYTFELRYDDADLGGVDETTLALYSWNGSRWIKEPSSSVDPGTNTLTAETQQTGLLSVLAEGKTVFLPFTTR